MAEEIINRVAQSPLITFDLEELYAEGARMEVDIKAWLYEGIILREKEFRKSVDEHDWSQYQDANVALFCSVDAIIPGWAFMLVASKLQPYANKVVYGSLEILESSLYQDILNNYDFTPYTDRPVIIKGCADKPVPQNAYLLAVSKMQEVAKCVMYGEACSAVPLYKRR